MQRDHPLLGQLEAPTNGIARTSGLGVKFGDLITIGLPNGINFIEACWGVWNFYAQHRNQCPSDYRVPSCKP
ncbi:hypothetical protein N2603_38645 [Bradyrhizobium huanghuaihaiense]|uniref:hypothetical protein n=1 Tax=Bradyrhizobium huanghuaihaiense TaxID=990078 RepID=UPI0021AA9501|nr:hypothetical protein [Bradyrhizobium sp. CB3035]UWU75821.1 hypothetical protein N2603_38645 [Bradyrhizobium sp. CB3035]